MSEQDGKLKRIASRIADRAGEEGLVDVAYGTLDTPMGTLLIASTKRGLVRIALPGADLDVFVSELSDDLSPRVLEYPRRLDEARRELDQYFEGRRRRFDLDLDWRLSNPGFYRRVLRAAAKVPFGEVITYRDAAGRAGNPRAFRAAGTACGHNPIPVIVPCHRVVQSGGGIGNYGGGPEMKKALLELEGAV